MAQATQGHFSTIILGLQSHFTWMRLPTQIFTVVDGMFPDFAYFKIFFMTADKSQLALAALGDASTAHCRRNVLCSEQLQWGPLG